jgi:aminoglycoside 6'-N-acetyltransferase I
MDIAALQPDHAEQAAALLVEAFAQHWPQAWPTMEDARAELHEVLAPDRVSLAATSDGALLGWIGALPTDYGPQTWELHPLVVAPAHQRRGVGRALVEALTRLLEQRGVLTLLLGSDDEDEMTSIGGRDLYPDVLGHLSRIEDHKGHPYAFYRRLGFAVVGVVPDANGPGRPDILMARRLSPRHAP